jgi:hypothetical protein
MMTDEDLRDLAGKWERWARYGDPSAFTPDDAELLLGEVRDLRVQHVRLVALVRQARDRLTDSNAQYRELIALPGVQALAAAHAADRAAHRQDRDDEFTETLAIAAQDQAEEQPP